MSKRRTSLIISAVLGVVVSLAVPGPAHAAGKSGWNTPFPLPAGSHATPQGTAKPALPPEAYPFNPVTPCRMFDTRTADTTNFCANAGTVQTAPIAADDELDYRVININPAAPGAVHPNAPAAVNLDGIPSDTTALVLNVTIVDATEPTYLTVFPDTVKDIPTISNVNTTTSAAVPNLVTVPVIIDGDTALVDFYNAFGSTDVVADLQGYYAPDADSGFTPVAPCRVFDTRGAKASCAFSPTVAAQKVGANQTLSVHFSPVAGVPADATAVVLNLTAVDASQPTFVTAYPTGANMPASSNTNPTGSNASPNLVTVQLGDEDGVTFYNSSGSVDLVADLAGYYAPGNGSLFTPLSTPCRAYDSRLGHGNCDPDPNVDSAGGLDADQYGVLQFEGVDTIPNDATAVVMNLTAVNATAPTFETAFPGNATDRPTVSNLNPTSSDAVANLAIVPLPESGPDQGTVLFYNAFGTVDLVMDVAGYFTNLT